MADTLSKLAKPEGATRGKTRKGRGVGSGLGKTAGRGQKGQYARRATFKPNFEGGHRGQAKEEQRVPQPAEPNQQPVERVVQQRIRRRRLALDEEMHHPAVDERDAREEEDRRQRRAASAARRAAEAAAPQAQRIRFQGHEARGAIP